MGGDKPRRYFLDKTSSEGAAFIPARKGLNVYATIGALKASNIQLPTSKVQMRLKQP